MSTARKSSPLLQCVCVLLRIFLIFTSKSPFACSSPSALTMLSKILAAALFLGSSCLAQTPTCGLVGYDSGTGDLGYYADSAVATYSSYSACNALCTSNTACLSFAYDPTVACILYGTVAEGNVVASSTSPWTFFDRGGVCPVVATTSSTSTGPAATATCTGLVGFDAVSSCSVSLYPSLSPSWTSPKYHWTLLIHWAGRHQHRLLC